MISAAAAPLLQPLLQLLLLLQQLSGSYSLVAALLQQQLPLRGESSLMLPVCFWPAAFSCCRRCGCFLSGLAGS